MTKTLRELVAENPGVDPLVLARKAMEIMPDDETIAVLAYVIKHEQRALTLEKEREAFGEFVRSGTLSLNERTEGRSADIKAFMEILSAPFRVGDGSTVTWGEATVEQHQQRIMMLAKMRDGIDRTISSHQAAITAIETAGVVCLDEVAAAAA